MANSLTTPDVLANTFCNDGDKTATIPVTATGTNGCSLEEGFPVITSTAVSGGGIPPKRTDFNGVFNLLSQYCLFLQNGGNFSYNASVATAIGGYPLGAVLRFYDGDVSYLISSLENNNTEAPTKANIKYRESDTNKKWKCLERVVVKADKDSDGNWYRLYNDNWCEQSGTVTTSVSQSGASTARIDFQFEFEDTDYFFTTEPRGVFDSSGNALYIAGRYGNKNTKYANITSKYISNGDTGVAGSVNYRWYACGYVVEEE